MIKRILYAALIAGSQPLRAQASAIIPPEARAALEKADRATPAAQRKRQHQLNALAVGKRRWVRARVLSYQVQTHVECFCFPSPNRDSVLPMLTVRAGQIVERSAGVAVRAEPLSVTVDTLFALVERDIRDAGRVVKALELDPTYGFPRRYDAETPTIPDLWIRIVVDSFVVLARGPTRTHP
jgi:hypothetical protein